MGLINKFLSGEPDAYNRCVQGSRFAAGVTFFQLLQLPKVSHNRPVIHIFQNRKLRIRTYNVSPLDDKCGILEWVDNLLAFSTAVDDANRSSAVNAVIHSNHFSQISLALSSSECDHPEGFQSVTIVFQMTNRQIVGKIREEVEAFRRANNEGGRRAVLDRVLTQFKPSLSYWFQRQFPDAPSWQVAPIALGTYIARPRPMMASELTHRSWSQPMYTAGTTHK